VEPAAEGENPEGISKVKHILSFILELNWFLSASAGLVAFLLVKQYGYDVVKVNSHDMRSTFHSGDAVLVKKFGKNYTTSDIIYFQYPGADSGRKTMLIQRLFGLPGDSFEIRNKKVYINGMKLADTSSLKHNYFMRTNAYRPDSAFMARYHLTEGGAVSDEYDFSFSLTFQQRWKLKRDPAVASVDLKIEKAGSYDENCFPGSPHFPWNKDHYGKIYIPRVNDSLSLDTASFRLYGTIIRDHEKNHAEIRGDSIFINDRYTTHYIVKKNYYFVLGDNRDNANDSRTWGYLPENLIAGKVIKLVHREK
jgi:signal peptidase I